MDDALRVIIVFWLAVMVPVALAVLLGWRDDAEPEPDTRPLIGEHDDNVRELR